MRIALERHAYAPGCQSIAAARAYCFPRYEARRIVAASYVRGGEFSGLNRTIRAAYPLEPNAMVRIACHARGLVDQGGALIVGRTLPPARLELHTRLAYVKGA